MATSSDSDRFRAGALLAALLILLSATAPAAARVLLGVDEALGLVYPGAEIERRTLYLDAEERARAEALAGGPLGRCPDRLAEVDDVLHRVVQIGILRSVQHRRIGRVAPGRRVFRPPAISTVEG